MGLFRRADAAQLYGTFVPAEDVIQKTADGRDIQIAAKGVPIPMPEAMRLGLVKAPEASGPTELKIAVSGEAAGSLQLGNPETPETAEGGSASTENTDNDPPKDPPKGDPKSGTRPQGTKPQGGPTQTKNAGEQK